MKSRSVRNPSASANEVFLRFTSSVHFDSKLWKHDIAGSIAHASALAKAGVITGPELEKILAGLRAIASDIESGEVVFDPRLEDIHMNIEKMLTDRIGDTGAKLHTGRSRNDQVALDVRLFVREASANVVAAAIELQETILARATETSSALLPGYTHLQHAQPVLMSHHLLAHFWKLQRDIDRLLESYERTNISPLGSGALAGTSFRLDRKLVADMLAMDGISQNSLDAVSDRDFVAESAFALSLMMIHLSSLCEELVQWSSQEFGFVKLPKDLSSGSSMMPQKRNPDLPELVRGKAGRAVGDLVAILTLLKSLPLAYNRDLQEDKETLFDVFETVENSLHALTAFLAEVEFDRVRMRRLSEVGLMTATDLADFLANQGVPFRKAHGLVREITEKVQGDERRFMLLADKVLRTHMKDHRTADVSFLAAAKAVDRRNIEGGTGRKAVAKQMESAKAAVRAGKKALGEIRAQVSAVDRLLA